LGNRNYNSGGNDSGGRRPATKNKRRELKEDAIDLRREHILELTSQGYSQRQIANMLQISHGTVGNEQREESMREY
jgi:DNA-binding NarL/FixJ family response regulator